MKYLAILKDSFREAIDTKVFYVMVGMSLLLTFLAMMLSFKPEPGDNIMKFLAVPVGVDDVQDLRPEQMIHLAMSGDLRKYEVVACEPADGAPEGPASLHRVTLVAHCKTANE